MDYAVQDKLVILPHSDAFAMPTGRPDGSKDDSGTLGENAVLLLNELPIEQFSDAMREPLSNIFAVLPMIMNRLENSTESIELVESVQQNLYPLLYLVECMTAAHRVCNGKLSKSQCFCAGELVRAIVEFAVKLQRKNSVPLNISCDDMLLPVKANIRLFTHAFLSILRNAFQYTRDGNEVCISVERQSKAVCITVKDKGLGIREEYQDVVMQPYFSVDPYGDNCIKPGMGLGLSNALCIAQRFGGALMVSSTFGIGTAVSLSLPLQILDDDILEPAPGLLDYVSKFSPIFIHLYNYCRVPPV